MSFEPKIIGFLCNWCSYTGADLAGSYCSYTCGRGYGCPAGPYCVPTTQPGLNVCAF